MHSPSNIVEKGTQVETRRSEMQKHVVIRRSHVLEKSDTVPTFSSANMYYQFTFIFVQLTGIFLDYKWTHSVRKASQYYKKILAWENVCNWLYAEKLLFRCHPVVFHVMFCRIPPFILTRFLGVSSIAFPSCFMEGVAVGSYMFCTSC
jgi:hypothetical protein